jgi:coenzyme F420-reducing hydrogenase beta subunit
VLNRPDLPDTYAAAAVTQSSSSEVLNECTSGGFIDALYRHVLERLNGYAVGVAFDDHYLPEHVITDSYETAKKFRNSKYAQSKLGTVFTDIKQLLMAERTVVFVGTPCQVAGLKSFLGRDYSNLIAVDLVCRSIPSPKLWRCYLDWQEDRYQSKIKQISCRKKTYGYHSGTLEILFENGKRYSGSNRVDYYMKGFHHDICSRYSCYHCPFKTKHRCSDFTVFDSWYPTQVTGEPMQDNNRGFSNVIVHTAKGKALLPEIQDIKIYQADPEKMFNFTGGMESRSIQLPAVRSVFYADLNSIGYINTAKKHVSVSVIDRCIEAIKPILYFTKGLLRWN